MRPHQQRLQVFLLRAAVVDQRRPHRPRAAQVRKALVLRHCPAVLADRDPLAARQPAAVVVGRLALVVLVVMVLTAAGASPAAPEVVVPVVVLPVALR